LPDKPYVEQYIDTNVFMDNPKEVFEEFEHIFLAGWIPSELDKLKVNGKTEETKFKARQASRYLDDNEDKITYIINETPINNLPSYYDKDNMDNKILSVLKQRMDEGRKIFVYSNDILFRQKCKELGIPYSKYGGNKGSPDGIYKGYKEVTLSEYELSIHYQCPINNFGLLNNEYLIIKDETGTIIDKQRWTDEKGFVPIGAKPLKSLYLGDIKSRDTYQMMAIDSLNNMDFTLLFGVAGSAKTLLSLGWIMQSIQTQKINKAVIIFNSVPLKNSQSQGFYPGDRNQKLLQSSLGGILSSKLGDMTMVETLITQGKLMLVPTCDIRGIEISEHDCLYVSEAQNIDAYTMRTILQRAKGKIIIEGDMLEQRDLRSSNPQDNGMLRAIEVFKGTKYFSCVKLKNTYRSPIAEIAQQI